MNPLSQPSAKFGNAGLFQNIINAVNTGVGAYVALQGQGGAGGGGQAQCARTMVECLDQLIGEYQAALRAIETRGGSNAEIAQLIQATLAALANPAVFPQGNNDPYYRNTVNQLNQRLASMQGGGATPGTIPAGGTTSGGSTVIGASAPLIQGIPNSYLLAGGAAAIIGGYLLSKKL